MQDGKMGSKNRACLGDCGLGTRSSLSNSYGFLNGVGLLVDNSQKSERNIRIGLSHP